MAVGAGPACRRRRTQGGVAVLIRAMSVDGYAPAELCGSERYEELTTVRTSSANGLFGQLSVHLDLTEETLKD